MVSEPSQTEDPVDLDMKKQIDKRAQYFLDYNCTPKYEKTSYFMKMNVYPELDNGILWQQNVDESILLNSDTQDSTYGNFAVRTLVLASYYLWTLSGIYDNFYSGDYPELKPYKRDFILFRDLAVKAGKKLCNAATLELENTVLSETNIAKVQPVYDELSTNWPTFETWIEPIWQVIRDSDDNTAAEVDAMMTPTCKEYPTADGKYVVVKCTVPPGQAGNIFQQSPRSSASAVGLRQTPFVNAQYVDICTSELEISAESNRVEM